MKSGRFLAVCLIGAASQVAACGPSVQQMESKLVSRASFDLDCPEGEIELTELDQATRGVSGCGRRASYIGICQYFECTWIQQGRNTASQ